jgi:hypothetical protein
MNQREKEVYELLVSRGCEVVFGGWPDFLVVNADRSRTFGVEVKHGGDTLTENQRAIHRLLERCGISFPMRGLGLNRDQGTSQAKLTFLRSNHSAGMARI